MPLDGRSVPVALSREAIQESSDPIAVRLAKFVTDFISTHAVSPSIPLCHVVLAGNGLKLRNLKDEIASEIVTSVPGAQLHDTLPLGEVVARGCAGFASVLASETIELDAAERRYGVPDRCRDSAPGNMPVPLPSFAQTFFLSDPWGPQVAEVD